MAAQPPVVGPLAPVANPVAEAMLANRAGPLQTAAEITEQHVLAAQKDCRRMKRLLGNEEVTPLEALRAELRFDTLKALRGKLVYPQASEGIADVHIAVQPLFQGLVQQLQLLLTPMQQQLQLLQPVPQLLQQSQEAQQGLQEQIQINTAMLNTLNDSIQDLGAKFTAQSQFDKRCRQNTLTHASGHDAIVAPPKVIPGLGPPLPWNLDGALEPVPQQLADLAVGDVPQSCPLSFAALREFTRAEINLLSMEYNDQMGITGDDGIASRRDKARRFLCGLLHGLLNT